MLRFITQSPQTIVAYIMEIDSTKEDIETANKEKLMAKRHSGIDTIVQDYSLSIKHCLISLMCPYYINIVHTRLYS